MQVVRTAAVDALASVRPTAAAHFWNSHPAVEISRSLAEIGRDSRERRQIDPRNFARIDDAARKSPLSPEPFLVRGVQAQTAGDEAAAGRAFRAAQRRDPRSLPAAYFLAGYDFRAGRPLEGLEQTALLARLSPNGTTAVAPFVAAYARQPSNWSQIRALLRLQPGIADSVLTVLAQDARSAPTILAIADRAHRRPDSPWLPVLLNSMVASGEYGRARALWAAIGGTGQGAQALLYDSSFSAPAAPPPFNWVLAGSSVGLAERQPGRRLHAIFYGSEDGVLASQLLLLPPGSYQLRMQVIGAPVHPEALSWSVRCDKSTEPVASMTVGDIAVNGWSFSVPANCAAQWLELSGRSGDVAQQSEIVITGLNLTRGGSNG